MHEGPDVETPRDSTEAETSLEHGGKAKKKVQIGNADVQPATDRQTQLASVVRFLQDCDADEASQVHKVLSKQAPGHGRSSIDIDIEAYDMHEDALTEFGGSRSLAVSVCSTRSKRPSKDAQLVNRRPSCIGRTPTVQFSSSRYYCSEDDAAVEVEIQRLNAFTSECSVYYYTKDNTAKAGQNFKHTEGLVTFGPGELEKRISVDLLDDDNWGGMLEFSIVLDKDRSKGVNLESGIAVARVHRIDDDTFPTNRFREEIASQQVASINFVELFVEYCKLNWSNEQIRTGSIKVILLGVLKNIVFFCELLMNVYMVDKVLIPHDDDSETTFLEPHQILVCIVSLNLLMLATLHYLDYAKCSWGTGGKARMCLQLGLADAFFSYDATQRQQVGVGDFAQAISTDVEILVKTGYMNALNSFQILGKIGCCVLFQVVAPAIFGKQATYSVFILVAAFPALIVGLLLSRKVQTWTVLHGRSKVHAKLVRDFFDTVANYNLIADCGKVVECLDQHLANVAAFSGTDRQTAQVVTTNSYLIQWLTKVFVSIFLVRQGFQVIEGNVSAGMFLTCLRVLITLGGMWGVLYNSALKIYDCAPSLLRIVELINLPKDSMDRMRWNLKQRGETSRLLSDVTRGEPLLPEYCAVDLLPIEIKDLKFSLVTVSGGMIVRETKVMMQHLNVDQGSLVALVGGHGCNRTTLLRVLGGSLLPPYREGQDPGVLFVPSHLRVLHVSPDPLFVRGTLLENLTFGCKAGHSDGNLDRVKAICRALHFSDAIMDLIDHGEQHEQEKQVMWTSSLANSERHLVNVARAFIANPDVLCIHKPLIHHNPQRAELIMTLMRDFVDERGLFLSSEEFAGRRPRTCIMSVNATNLGVLECCDAVYWVKQKGLIERADQEMWAHCQTEMPKADTQEDKPES